MSEHYDVIVIGGGTSGLMAAGTAARNGHKVLLLEKNAELGKKLKITGGGRCNITNATFDNREFLSNFGAAAKFLHSPLSQFDVQATFDFFEQRELPLVVQARRRAFPHTEKAMDVFLVMEKYSTHENLTLLLGHPVTRMNMNGANTQVLSVTTPHGNFTAEKYILCAGGSSHPETGSTGDGFAWLKLLGHTIKDPTPSIVPLRCPDSWIHKLSGTSLSFMKITFFVESKDGKKKKAFSKTGKILFTHFGISSPLILNCAHLVSDLLYGGQVTATIDCYPDTDHAVLEKQILKIFDENKNKAFKNIVKDITPKGLHKTLLEFNVVADPEIKVHSLSKEERKAIVQLLKALPLRVSGLMGMDRAVISDGGVPLTEVDTRTMKSRKITNLYLTGDILHINRPSGGYSFQLCWSTGWVAGHLKD
jgi:hypothetical protein